MFSANMPGWVSLGDIWRRLPDLSRLRKRRVDPLAEAAHAIALAWATGEPVVTANHGGSVPRQYRFMAETEAILTTADPLGRAVVRMDLIPAQNASLRGVASRIFRQIPPDWFDSRIRNHERKEDSKREYLDHHRRGVLDGRYFLTVAITDPVVAEMVRDQAPARIIRDYILDQGINLDTQDPVQFLAKLILQSSGRQAVSAHTWFNHEREVFHDTSDV